MSGKNRITTAISPEMAAAIKDRCREMTGKESFGMPVVSSKYVSEGELFIQNPRAHAMISDIQKIRYEPSVAHQAEDRRIDEIKQMVHAGILTQDDAMDRLSDLKDNVMRKHGESDDALRERIRLDAAYRDHTHSVKSPQEEFQDALENL